MAVIISSSIEGKSIGKGTIEKSGWLDPAS